MAITTLSKVKTYLGITDTLSDSKISALIPLVEQDYLDIRNCEWATIEGVSVYPIGSDVTAAEMIQYKLETDKPDADLQSETIGSYSYSRLTSARYKGYPSDIVASIKKYIRGL